MRVIIWLLLVCAFEFGFGVFWGKILKRVADRYPKVNG